MTEDSNKTIYLLDTNILIGLNLWKPIVLKLNNRFWSDLSKKLAAGKWVLLDVIVGEITGNKNLKRWCKEQREKGLIRKIDDKEVFKRSVEINNLYEMIDQNTGKSSVDTYLIAYAEKNKLGIISREYKKPNNERLYKIPDVCEKLKIPYNRLPIFFFRTVGFY